MKFTISSVERTLLHRWWVKYNSMLKSKKETNMQMLTEAEEEIRIRQTRKWGTPPIRLSLGMSREGWRCTRKVFSYFPQVFRPTNNRGSLHWRFQRSTLAPSGVSAKCRPPFRPAGKKKHSPQVIFTHTTFRASAPFKQQFQFYLVGPQGYHGIP